jgi:hypothetical protein
MSFSFNATINFHGVVNVLGMFDVLPHVPNVIFGALDIPLGGGPHHRSF